MSSSSSRPRTNANDGFQLVTSRRRRNIVSTPVEVELEVEVNSVLPNLNQLNLGSSSEPQREVQRAPVAAVRGGFGGGRGGFRGRAITRTIVCGICNETKLATKGRNGEFLRGSPCAFKHEMGQMDEGHQDYCKSCLYEYISTKIHDAHSGLNIRCPHPSCTLMMYPYRIWELTFVSEQDGEKLREKIKELQKKEFRGRLQELFSGKTKLTPEEELFSNWLKDNTRYCPRCHIIIERSVGCNHLLCCCGFNFCYGCGEGIQQCQCESLEQGQRPIQKRMTAPTCTFCSGYDHERSSCPRLAIRRPQWQKRS